MRFQTGIDIVPDPGFINITAGFQYFSIVMQYLIIIIIIIIING